MSEIKLIKKTNEEKINMLINQISLINIKLDLLLKGLLKDGVNRG